MIVTPRFKAYTNEELKTLISKGVFEGLTAKKTGLVEARNAVPGEEVITLADQGVLVETKNRASLEKPQMVVTNKVGGRKNAYLVDAKKFATLYERVGQETFSPVSPPKRVYRVDRNVVFVAPWEEEFRLLRNGVLVEDGAGFYGINPLEFEATYSVIAPLPEENVMQEPPPNRKRRKT